MPIRMPIHRATGRRAAIGIEGHRGIDLRIPDHLVREILLVLAREIFEVFDLVLQGC
jgi:hypothetical protein